MWMIPKQMQTHSVKPDSFGNIYFHPLRLLVQTDHTHTVVLHWQEHLLHLGCVQQCPAISRGLLHLSTCPVPKYKHGTPTNPPYLCII